MRFRVIFSCTALAMAAATMSALPTMAASAAPSAPVGQIKLTAEASGGGPGQNVSSIPSSSWQTNNTVWAIAVSNGVVYVGGAFTSVRPPGDPLGTGEVPRTYLAAFSSTGSLMPFDPTLNGEVTALAVSPDGTTLYAGGSFTQVDGLNQKYLAAFSTATGAQIPTWTPTATGSVHT